MKLIELHILQSFPVTCLNRDDLGAPKTAIFGGVTRARVSSQSWKRSIRLLAREKMPDAFGGVRSRLILPKLNEILEARGATSTDAERGAHAIAEALGKVEKEEARKGRVKTMIYFSPQELDQIVDSLPELSDISDQDLAAAAKKASKKLSNQVKDAADIMIFGRMVADDHSLTVEGAGLFSHALSTHKADNEIDFFTAVDDLQPQEESGAGMTGVLEFNSACYYRYIGLNLDLLKGDSHLGHLESDKLQEVVENFVEASILAVPGARKNSMFGFNPPVLVLGFLRQGQPISLVNAFEEPIRPAAGYVKPSIEALESHVESLEEMYGLDVIAKWRMPGVSLQSFCEEVARDATQ